MKLILATPALAVLGLTACGNLNQPISSGDFDPLRPPGSGSNLNTQVGPLFKAGQFVRAAIENTAFFRVRPKGEADADKLLPRGTSMKVISIVDSYVKVELDSGDVGFVPSVMVEDPNAAAAMPATANPNEFQVYPPVGGFGEPIPTVKPGEMPPDGAIPAVIDPEAPGNPAPVPPVTPPAGDFPAAEANPQPAPLPPNGTDGSGSTPLPPNGEEQ